MHRISHDIMREFVQVHLEDLRGVHLDLLDFGSQVVDDQPLSYVDLIDDPEWRYVGLDIEPGKNVDIVVDDPYHWPDVASDSFDVVISGQAFEHIEYFWASIFEIMRVMRPGGVAAIIAPSGGFEHRYPLDCWRYYPDGFRALTAYVGGSLVDVFTDWNHGQWDDSIVVFEKPVWSDAERSQFALRAAMQRALIGDATAFDPSSVPDVGPAPEPSPARGRRVGALTTQLARLAGERKAAEARAAEEAQIAQAEAREAEIAARVDQAVEAHLHAITPLRWYGRLRAGFAAVVGARGRAAYKRLRGRS